MVVDLGRRPRPVHARLGFIDLSGVSHPFRRLRGKCQGVCSPAAPAPPPSGRRRRSSAGHADRRPSYRVRWRIFQPIATGPVSRPSSMLITIMPVSASPAMMARWMGAAPRQRGNSEAWPLRQPSRGRLENRPSAAATHRRRPRRHRPARRGKRPARPRPSARPAYAPRCPAARPRAAPATASVPARAGRRRAAAACRRLTISCPASAIARSVGTENSGVPMKMTRRGIFLSIPVLLRAVSRLRPLLQTGLRASGQARRSRGYCASQACASWARQIAAIMASERLDRSPDPLRAPHAAMPASRGDRTGKSTIRPANCSAISWSSTRT